LVGAEIPLLGKIPFDPQLQDGGDTGHPAYLNPNDLAAKAVFDELLGAMMIRPKSLVGVPLSLHT
jgi:ATP-binding protein involved in chromosome partitioning